MTKQQILDECARRLGDEDSTFKSGQLSNAFSFVLLELAQENCLSLLRKTFSFAFNNPACVASNNLLQINLATLLSLSAGQLPERITDDLLVPAWGAGGRIKRLGDMEFIDWWMNGGSTTGKPRYWRMFPNNSQLQLWPAPDADSLTATCILEYQAPPTLIADGDNITEVLPSDLPTLLAGLYRHGCVYRDETFNDMPRAEAMWQRGVMLMRERRTRAEHYGRRNQIAYRDF